MCSTCSAASRKADTVEENAEGRGHVLGRLSNTISYTHV